MRNESSFRLEYWKSGTSGSEFAASIIPGFFFSCSCVRKPLLDGCKLAGKAPSHQTHPTFAQLAGNED
ncbi:hypothetical protein I7I53_11668 [Histoplasma capsulatum var. duboisii H88]|uniref:Uncharacterized protein n=1 Tax=Ajellomyces capsulatus (strain H88) TaxID=544711 RepID=A0A8A1LTP8_AJEC8|nr:hypothetical protein I7I53_11668 [Histoplasma capsulatum var. duboisii H88]